METSCEKNITEPSFKDGVYYFRKQDSQVTPIRCNLFSDDELFRVGIAVLIMERLFKNLGRSEAVKAAYEEFIEETKKPSSDNPYEVETVDRRFRAFAFEWKLYTEHWKSYIFDLDESVWPDEFVAGYKDIYRKLMGEAFGNPDFVVAHILRNYVSHANDAINRSHVDGTNNKFCIYRTTLEKFLQGSIDKTSNSRRKDELQDQLNILKTQDELIDLSIAAEKAMVWLEKCEKTLLDYQVAEPQLLQACNILTKVKQRIDEANIQSDVWEFWTTQPMYLDHQGFHSLSLQANIDGKEIILTYYRNRLNWVGYGAIISYLMGLIEKSQQL